MTAADPFTALGLPARPNLSDHLAQQATLYWKVLFQALHFEQRIGAER